MKKYKYRAARLFQIAMWSVIFILSINLLIKCIRIYRTNSPSQTTQSLESNLVSAACNYMIQSNIPILDYIAKQDESGNNNFILNTLAGVFPINRYVAEANEYIDDNLIDEQKESLLLTNGLNIKFDNAAYLTLITGENSTTDDKSSLVMSNNVSTGIMPIDIISGEVYLESEDTTGTNGTAGNDVKETLGSINGEHFTLDQLMDRQFLYNNFYIIDPATVVSDELFDAEALLGKNMTMEQDSDKPQILIYHTHSQEGYSDSRPGVEADTVVGLGTYLTKLLTENGYNVIHDKSKYDMMEGYEERNLAYNHANDGIAEILKQNPSIEVIIDIHRDSGTKRVAIVNGKDNAKLMLFNGLSRNTKGEIAYLKNPLLQDNLAFSLQLQLKGRELYPGVMHRNYLHAYRYNMNYRAKTLLVETGTVHNTLAEAMNSMEPLSDILYEVLAGES